MPQGNVGDGNFPDIMHVESEPQAPLSKAPEYRNLTNIQAPQGITAEATQDLIARAAELTGFKAAHITAGYIDKLDPFKDASTISRNRSVDLLQRITAPSPQPPPATE